MSKHVIIDKNKKVINIIELEPNSSWTPPEGCSVIQNDEASIGWSYINNKFTAPIISNPEKIITPLTIPQQIAELEALITPRMLRETSLNATSIGLGENGDLTSKQYIIQINTRIEALRKQL